MEQRNAELRENLRQSTDWFLRELKGLRAQAGLDHGELAARAHYPRAVITAAEARIPELPVLAAYVRGCGGTEVDVEEWEDRWRSVSGATASPLLPAREGSGASPGSELPSRSAAPRAEVPRAEMPPAGATAAADGQDPGVIIAALNRYAERMAQPTPPAPPTPDSLKIPNDRPGGPGDNGGATRGPGGADAGQVPPAPFRPAPLAKSTGPASLGGRALGLAVGMSGRALVIAAAVVVGLLLLLITLL